MAANSLSARLQLPVTKGDIQFQKELPENFDLECPVCFEILIQEPYLSECCGRHFCGNCSMKLRPLWTGKSSKRNKSYSCPICKSMGTRFNLVRDKSHDRILGAQVIYCTNKATIINDDDSDSVPGCNWEGELRDLVQHLDKDCPYVDVTCPHLGCGVKVCRSDLTKHTTEDCIERPYDCKYCGLKGTFNYIHNMHHSVCHLYPIRCPLYCDTPNFPRSQVNHHLERDCPLSPVNCIYKPLGCSEKPKRNKLETHLSTPHHGILVTAYQRITDNLKRSQDEFRESLGSLEKKYNSLKSGHDSLNFMHEDLKRSHAQLEKNFKRLSSDHKILYRKFKILNRIVYVVIFVILIAFLGFVFIAWFY
ncbi:PREDICTED: TNF receptor-associated factor family protein DDB_G0272340-like [Amphimedon queenslandica]|uniref:RING-type domain-containing protein n=1 Tax=Amphimedon queenslandica TaxID=400682 RepID=A0A1X7U5L9_AMPQE|nr:PREDICTED: TNF receptor-associated factor family protein DDB_G0272340-like [Amphimedon queenslandica]|eukprot:XP_011405981.1 PREDICTED: TNF receptor-associated factor family protein DDB_G0272340-like [Amphimedon queenslandica]